MLPVPIPVDPAPRIPAATVLACTVDAGATWPISETHSSTTPPNATSALSRRARLARPAARTS